jgi:hypothetical protein
MFKTVYRYVRCGTWYLTTCDIRLLRRISGPQDEGNNRTEKMTVKNSKSVIFTTYYQDNKIQEDGTDGHAVCIEKMRSA